MLTKVLVFGAGGHAKVVIEALQSHGLYQILGVIDDNKDTHGTYILDVLVLGDSEQLKCIDTKDVKVIIAIGNPKIREQKSQIIASFGYDFCNAVHISAIVSESVDIGKGNYIAPGVIVTTDTKIGNHCIFNTGSTVDHDCIIGDFTHISPGVHLAGSVHIGEHSHIGIGSNIIENIHIGSHTTIGAGSVVLNDIQSDKIAYGHPCKVHE